MLKVEREAKGEAGRAKGRIGKGGIVNPES